MIKATTFPPPSAAAFHRQSTTFPLFLSSPGDWCAGGVIKDLKFANLQCKAVFKPHTKEYLEVLEKNGLQFVNWENDTVEDDVDTENAITAPARKISMTSEEIKEYVKKIKSKLGWMDEGEISVSAYDTAWVALVRNVDGSECPQFPKSLQWTVDNQLADGSWGDDVIFTAHDRIINTLASVIALTSWNIHPEKCQKGLKFLEKNMHKLGDEKEEHMPVGFEIVLPSLIDVARKLNIEVKDDSQVLKKIYNKRDLKLTQITKEMMHKRPTTLLHSLEGMPHLEWEKLLKLQCKDGSFLFSPASTAFALMQTKDPNCLTYLTNLVAKFNGPVPNVYPVDLFEHIWVVDRLQRLGISRYFQSEIKDCVDYVYRYWTNEGISWAKNSNVKDIDDTAMGFRILRMNGYQVSSDVFRQFEKEGKFVCFHGQVKQAVTGMFNLYRASHLLFPGEELLNNAKKFSYNYLREKQSKNELLDKWIIAKDLPGEVGFALDVPWYACLPRVETRYYLDQYGGEDDVWIGKTLYRMGNVSNNTYLEMAKLDYNKCLAMHHLEWSRLQQWYAELNTAEYGLNNIKSCLFAYYFAAASIFEPERTKERIAWAKTSILIEIINSCFVRYKFSNEQKRVFVKEFINTTSFDHRSSHNKKWQGLMGALHDTLSQFSLDALVTHGRDIHPHICHAWKTWLMRWQDGADVIEGQVELIVKMINIVAGRWTSEKLLVNPQYQRLSVITNNLCQKLSDKEICSMRFKSGVMTEEIESEMQELVYLVFCGAKDEDVDLDLKQTFLTVVKTFYYRAYCNPETINVHVSKVLFEDVV